MPTHSATILGVIVIVAQMVGIVTAIQAVMEVRTSQGAIAWALSLIMFPPVAVPLYWVFGRSKFQGYVRARRAGDSEISHRIVLPENPDHLLVYLSAFSFLDEAEQAGVKIYRYLPGFMHHKILLIDHDPAAVGTANLDNRSLRLNFEITVIVADEAFAGDVERMFESDFSRCRIAKPEDLAHRWFGFKLAVRVARLLAPVQ